eukprot:TRINITY_DN7296_c0_g1_i17.p1 TRINITY_DN7296_c0_g1~~TRINITY_DN7296_c0_g1_i17.p1  ORF type:complete len:124 (+),score=24.15 TRINITY_DN7296_c0_g1_i17:189-560(+)
MGPGTHLTIRPMSPGNKQGTLKTPPASPTGGKSKTGFPTIPEPEKAPDRARGRAISMGEEKEAISVKELLAQPPRLGKWKKKTPTYKVHKVGKLQKKLNFNKSQIGRAVQQECRDRSRMPSSA